MYLPSKRRESSSYRNRGVITLLNSAVCRLFRSHQVFIGNEFALVVFLTKRTEIGRQGCICCRWGGEFTRHAFTRLFYVKVEIDQAGKKAKVLNKLFGWMDGWMNEYDRRFVLVCRCFYAGVVHGRQIPTQHEDRTQTWASIAHAYRRWLLTRLTLVHCMCAVLRKLSQGLSVSTYGWIKSRLIGWINSRGCQETPELGGPS